MKLVILDRDGVINYDSEHYIKSVAEWQAIPGSLAAIAKLNQAGFKIAIASNQSGIARGLYTEAELLEIHLKMQQELKNLGGCIEKICYCPHHPNENCHCRKPRTGMLLEIEQHFSCSLKDVPVIGDRLSDVLAAKTVAARPLLVKSGYLALDYSDPEFSNIPIYEDLTAAVNTILGK